MRYARPGLTVEQRAFIVGEEGICPECEAPVRWNDIDHEWFICEQCIHDIVRAGEADRARLNNDLYVHARQREDA